MFSFLVYVAFTSSSDSGGRGDSAGRRGLAEELGSRRVFTVMQLIVVTRPLLPLLVRQWWGFLFLFLHAFIVPF